MALGFLALVLWIPLGVVGVWLLVTGRRIAGRPKGLKEGLQLRIFGLAYVLAAGYVTYRAIHDGSYEVDGLVMGYAVLIVLAMVALYRWRKARQVERFT
jgi:hypothetical protein